MRFNTNTKEFKEKVFNYIIGCVNTNDTELVITSEQHKVYFVLETFKTEYGWYVKKVGKQKAFAEWLAGLPSVLDIDFENHKILEVAMSWNTVVVDKMTPKQKEKFEIQVLSQWWNFISMKFWQLCEKHQIKVAA
jgi:hypothetical protein